MPYDRAGCRVHCAERRPWSDAERWVLASLWDGHGKWWDGWAKALPGRTPDAIADQAKAMGLAWKRPRDKWTPEEDACLLRHIMEVSQETGRAPSSVARRRASAQRETSRHGEDGHAMSDGTAHEGLDRLRAEALDYELMGEEFASISCSQLLAWVFDALAEREELRDELAYLRMGRDDK